MSRYTHKRSYRTMIDVVGNGRAPRGRRLRPGVKRLVFIGVLLFGLSALWPDVELAEPAQESKTALSLSLIHI